MQDGFHSELPQIDHSPQSTGDVYCLNKSIKVRPPQASTELRHLTPYITCQNLTYISFVATLMMHALILDLTEQSFMLVYTV